MTIRLTPEQVDDAIDEIFDLLNGTPADAELGRPAKPGLRTLHAELRASYERDRADGHRRTVGLDRAGGDPDYDIELDEHGDPVLDPATGDPRKIPLPPRSDPTAAAVLARNARDPITVALEALVNGIHNARRGLESAETKGMEARPPDDTTEPPDNNEPWCRSCLRIDWHVPRADGKGRGGLCGWCYGFVREYKQWPPAPLLRRRSTGQRIYQRDINAALEAQQPRKGAKRTSKKKQRRAGRARATSATAD